MNFVKKIIFPLPHFSTSALKIKGKLRLAAKNIPECHKRKLGGGKGLVPGFLLPGRPPGTPLLSGYTAIVIEICLALREERASIFDIQLDALRNMDAGFLRRKI